jgi:A/G-specific adenine glycosylase
LGYAGEVDSAVGRQQLWGAAESWLPRKDVGSFNQAMMEIGSLVCRPRNPVCDECPLVESCVAHAEGIQRTLPKLKPRRKREKVRTAAVVVRRRGRVLVAKSNGEASGRWAGLWDFPRFDVAISASQSRVATDVTAALAVWGVDVTLGEQLTTIKHAVTHHDITVDCYAAVCNEDAKTNGTHNGRPELRWVRPDELEELPMNVTARRLADVISKL